LISDIQSKGDIMKTGILHNKITTIVSIKYLVCMLCYLFVMSSHADEVPDVQRLQTQWADIKYNLPAAEQERAFEALVVQAEKMTSANNRPPYLIWEGIIRSTYAGVKGGLGALDQVKQAKKLFEQAIKLDPEAMNGSAYTSLGSLYYQVPGWPLGFGDDKKAKEMLIKGLSYNPDGIDSNYFYGDFLLKQKQYQQAIVVFEKALKAAPRPGRESADAGRKAEIEAAMVKARKHL
jgi:tetratricopeptide (TPR) repeat protein